MSSRLLMLVVLLCALLPSAVQAHRPSDSYLVLEQSGGAAGLTGHWDIHLRDLDYLLGLDLDGDGLLRWGELRSEEQAVTARVLSTLQLSAGGVPCVLQAGALSITEHSDGTYARLPVRVLCQSSAPLTLRYTFLASEDPSHRGVVRVQSGARTLGNYVLGSTRPAIRLSLAQPVANGFATDLLRFVWQGIVHIFEGTDHVLFLVVLLLPAVLQRRADGWYPASGLRQVLLDVARIVTAFTVAHSLTLSLAALGLVSVSSSIIEPAIAASVTLAAANNLFPVLGSDRWAMALALGLLHGFGFSAALADSGLEHATLLPALLGFNVGVELGQLTIVSLFIPCAFVVRKSLAYRSVGLRLGSLVVLVFSLFWLFQRVQVG